MSKTERKTTEAKVNFLASEVGLRTVTYQFDATGISADADGKKIVKGGTIISGKGIVFDDVDVTIGAHEGSLIVAGHILNDKLPVAADSTAKTAFAAQGLYFENSDAQYRAGITTKGKSVAISTDGGTATFNAADLATDGDGLTLSVTGATISVAGGTAHTTVAVASGTVTVTADGSNNESGNIACTVTDSVGTVYSITVPFAVTGQA